MQLLNYLNHFKENGLLTTPGDRAEIILGALQANLSANYPNASGIILTGGLLPEDSIMSLIEGLSEVVPIASVKYGTYATANKVGAVKPRIYAENTRKITTSIQDFETFIPVNALAEKVITFKASGITPRMFQFNLVQTARDEKKRIVLPEGTDDRILQAVKELLEADVVDIILLGDPTLINDRIRQMDLDLDIDKVQIIDPQNSEYFEDYVQTLYELRKHKNLDLTMASDLMSDISYFGTMMVYKGHADGMVSGAVHTTQHTIRPALQFIKTRPDVSIVTVDTICFERIH